MKMTRNGMQHDDL